MTLTLSTNSLAAQGNLIIDFWDQGGDISDKSLCLLQYQIQNLGK